MLLRRKLILFSDEIQDSILDRMFYEVIQGYKWDTIKVKKEILIWYWIILKQHLLQDERF